ncbi:hypothetical protein HPB49_017951 [Dermacentor silvarum]|uniref:Uncharacterized protein n=1 Tax=Dermacentor silvarum TaxID=543639 RepID=A0ACB8CGI9_DERSI|nr:hypothetical protein HPB49_017951 [Dermacentor silvarum]
MPTFGSMEAFEGESDAWPAYVERVQEFFEADDVVPAKKRSIFLSCCVPRTNSLLRSLVKPETPQDQTLDEILAVLGRHYAPTPSVVVQRFRFNSRTKPVSCVHFVVCAKSSCRAHLATILHRSRLTFATINQARHSAFQSPVTMEAVVSLLRWLHAHCQRDEAVAVQPPERREAPSSSIPHEVVLDIKDTED